MHKIINASKNNREKINIIALGGSSAIMLGLLEKYSQEYNVKKITLIGRDLIKLNKVKKHLQVIKPSIKIYLSDIEFNDDCVKKHYETGYRNIFISAVGYYELEENMTPLNLENSRWVNYLLPKTYLSSFWNNSQLNDQAIIISSVAGEVPRKSIQSYALAKRELNKFVLKNKSTNSKNFLVKPGPTDTVFTQKYNLKKVYPLALIVDSIYDQLRHGNKIIYAPKNLKLVFFILKCLPKKISTTILEFNK